VAGDVRQHRSGLGPVPAGDLLAELRALGGLPHDRHRIRDVLLDRVGDPERDGVVGGQRALTERLRAAPDCEACHEAHAQQDEQDDAEREPGGQAPNRQDFSRPVKPLHDSLILSLCPYYLIIS